jgi:hypothetical protein
MFDTFNRHSANDFRQRYNNVMGWLIHPPNTGVAKTLVMVSTVGDTSVILTGLHGEKYTVFPDNGVQFEFLPINKGFKQVGDKVYHLSRHPERQWTRGISAGNTRVHLVQESYFDEQMWSFELMVDIFKERRANKNTTDYLALSQEFAISPRCVWFFDMKIGVRVKDTLVLDNSLVSQELNDVIRRNKYSFVVETNEHN